VARAKSKGASGPGKDPRHDAAFAAAITAALEERDGDETKLHRVAQTLVALAIDGNMTAIKEISDRLDGKPGAPRLGDTPAAASKHPIEIQVQWLKN